MADLTLSMDSMTYGGYALSRTPDGPVFVRHAAAGEHAQVRLDHVRRGVRFGTAVRITDPSPERVESACPHFGVDRCGGCHWQFMHIEAQQRWKTHVVREQFRRIGGFAAVHMLPVVPSPAPYGYRAHLTLHLDAGGRACFYAEDERTLLPVGQCALAHPALQAVLDEVVRMRWRGPGRLRLMVGSAPDDVLVVLDRPLQAGQRSSLPLALLDHQGIAHPLSPHDKCSVRFSLSDTVYQVNGGSFFQANPAVAERLQADIVALIPPDTPLALDLYAGVGLFSRPARARAQSVVSVELSAAASQDARVNLYGMSDMHITSSDTLEYLRGCLHRPQVVIVDPPRAGLGAQVCAELLRLAPPLVLYVSCDPTTLARDARALCAGGYRVRSVQPYDMFPQTYHVESLLVLDFAGN